ncbi:MAG: Ig-like domain-containing protein, partial [Candidatus Dojkabacteria bacterium]
MQRKKNLLLSGLIALLLLFGLIAPQMAEARDIIINADTTLTMDPATLTATTCGTVDVNVRVNEVVNLTAFHLEVTYDRTKVEVLSVTNGGFLTPPTLGELYEPTNTLDLSSDPTGRILWGMAQQGVGGDPTPKNGSGNLITITLKSLATTGTTTIAIDGAKSMLVDWPEAQAIPYTVAGSTTLTLQSCAPTDIALSNATVDENQPVGTLVGNLSATDPDAGDTTFSYQLVDTATYPDNASFQIVGNELQTKSVFDYETKDSYQIKLQVSDPHGMTYAKVFTITVNDVNDAPVAQDQSVTTPEDTLIDITLVATDVDGDALTYAIVAQPAHGTVTLVDNVATYTPALDFNGTDTFTFKANDGTVDSNVATVTITITPVNDAPVAQDQSVTTPEDTPIDITLVATDVDGDTLTYAIVAPPAHGTGTLVDNVATYTPDLDYYGTDSFTYKANDGLLDSNTATVTITVTPVKDQVVAVDDDYDTNEGETLTVAAPGVLANDIDVDLNIMTAGLVTDVQHGNLSLNGDGSFVYVPDPNFFGTDTFEYQLVTYPAPQSLWTDKAVVTITVHEIAGTIEPDGGTGQIPGGDPLVITNIDGVVSYLGEIAWYPEDLSIGRTAGSRVGVIVRAPEDFDTTATTFTAFDNTYNWEDVNDGDNYVLIYPKVTEIPQSWDIVVTWAANSTQTFTVKVLEGSTLQDVTPPTILDGTAFGVAPFGDVLADSTLTFTVPQGYEVSTIEFTMSEPVTVVAGTEVTLNGVPYGLVTVDDTGLILVVTPYAGNEIASLIGTFTFVVPEDKIFDLSDNPLETLSATLIVTNVAPVAVDDAYTTDENVALTIDAPGVLGNDTDFDPTILTAVKVTGPINGTLVLNPDGSFTYTPNTGFKGVDIFTYKANDGELDSNIATVRITVEAYVNTPVVAEDDYYETMVDTTLIKDAAE